MIFGIFLRKLINKGKIKLGGLDLSNIDTKSWRNLCGVVMQDGYIFSDTISRNITESRSEIPLDKEKLVNAVKIANIEEMIEKLPTGYNTLIGSAGSTGLTLSGGQVQRTLIARAVYKDPDFLFFDEATSALDANNEKTILDNLDKFFNGKTVVVMKRFRTGIVMFSIPNLLTEEGLVWYDLFANTFNQLYERKNELIDSIDVSNQSYVFSFESLKKTNTQIDMRYI